MWPGVTHIDGSFFFFFTSEVLSTGCNVSRKERNIHGGGGFVTIADQFVSITELSLDSKCEIMWCNISIKGVKLLYIASFYRPTNEDPNR